MLELQQRTKARSLTPEQESLLVELLKANPKGDVSLSCINGNKESCDFARQLASALASGGWKVDGPTDIVVFGAQGGPPVGLIVTVANKEKMPIRAVSLYKAFERMGLSPMADVNAGLDENAVNLMVGAKP